MSTERRDGVSRGRLRAFRRLRQGYRLQTLAQPHPGKVRPETGAKFGGERRFSTGSGGAVPSLH